MNGVTDSQILDALSLGLLLGSTPPQPPWVRYGRNAGPPSVEPALHAKDGVDRHAGLRKCGTVQETDSVDIAHSIEPGSLESHPLVHFEKRAVVNSESREADPSRIWFLPVAIRTNFLP